MFKKLKCKQTSGRTRPIAILSPLTQSSSLLKNRQDRLRLSHVIIVLPFPSAFFVLTYASVILGLGLLLSHYLACFALSCFIIVIIIIILF